MTGKPLINFRERLASEVGKNEWPRFSEGTFFDELTASATADEWKALEEDASAIGEETTGGQPAPGDGSAEGAPGEGQTGTAREPAGLYSPGLLVLGAVILLGLILIVARIIRKRGGNALKKIK